MDSKADPWTTVIVPIIKEIPRAKLARATGLSERTISALRNGDWLPSRTTREVLARVAAEYAVGAAPSPTAKRHVRRYDSTAVNFRSIHK